MSREKNIEEKIIDHIQKTGFPTELMVGRELTLKRWQIEESRHYLDRDEGKSREIDLVANRIDSNPHNTREYLRLHLVIEVKKSDDRHWVIFTSRRRDDDRFLHDYILPSGELYKEKQAALESEFPSRPDRIGRTSYVYPNDNQDPFKAFIAAFKASSAFRDDVASIPTPPDNPRIEVFIPVVVLDAPLYEVWIDDRNELSIQRVPILSFNFNYRSVNYPVGRMIQIITKDYLPTFLDEWSDTLRYMHNSVRRLG